MSALAVLHSRALLGLDAPAVAVEVHVANGLPSFTLVGLPEAEVKEARDRVRAALAQCRFDFPAQRITANLAPADLPKESGRFDLPIALGILAASAQLRSEALQGYEFAGELGLSGELRSVRGALAMALAARQAGRALILPRGSAQEAALVDGVQVYCAAHLLEVVAHFSDHPDAERLPRAVPGAALGVQRHADLSDIRGQNTPKRALEIAAAGGHSVLMVGPPGTGKSMLAQRLIGLLPAMQDAEAIESAATLSLAGKFDVSRFRERPYRAPHHSASAVALVGGGSNPRPGEISLAHRGVLFLDELPEFDRNVLEALREPLESGRITVSRAARQADFPAKFQLVAAMNPCPCGYLGHPKRACKCTPDQVLRYQSKISGPLLDRIDLQVTVLAVGEDELLGEKDPRTETSAVVAARAGRARDAALARQGYANAELDANGLDTHCALDEPSREFLARAMARLHLSARSAHRIVRLARTIADLGGAQAIAPTHLGEAIQLRRGLLSA